MKPLEIRPQAVPPEDRRWRATRTALHLSADLDFDEWVGIGRKVAVVADSAAWWIGDWLIFGRKTYPRRYRAASASTSLDYKTLRNYAWVASRFARSRRNPGCSFGHHAELAALPEADADAWLTRCANEQWSRGELRAQLRREKKLPTPQPNASAIALSVQPERRKLWETAATAAGTPLTDWIEAAVDRAAEDALVGRSPILLEIYSVETRDSRYALAAH